MNRYGMVLMVLAATIIAYLVLLVIMPTITDIVSTANTTMASTSNMTNYFGVQEVTVSSPWWMFFLPGAVGITMIIIILKQP